MNFSRYTPGFEPEQINNESGCLQNVYVDENLQWLEVCKKAVIVFQKVEDLEKYNVFLIKQDYSDQIEQRVQLNDEPMLLQDAHKYAKDKAVRDDVPAFVGRKFVCAFKDLPSKTKIDIRNQAIL